MTTQNNDVPDLENQALNAQRQVAELKRQIFHIADDLHMLYGSYDDLQVITSDCSGDATHCCAVLYGLNYRFEDLLKRLDVLYKKPEDA